jgi:hypothetical protein
MLLDDIDDAEDDANSDDDVPLAVLAGRGRSGREPLDKGAMRARGEASLSLQGVWCLSARSSAL